MGNQLDVLIGHPEHDLVFIGVQVAQVAGLKDPSTSVMSYRQSKAGKLQTWLTLKGLIENSSISVPEDERGRTYRSTMAMLTESQTYQMLLRGHAPASEPFRKWVTEEVLPSIRKTGSYDIGTSTTPEAQQLSMDYGDLRALIENMAI